jgi:hypothetical protein
MIIKSRDDSRGALAAIKGLLALDTISPAQREGLDEELTWLKRGIEGEKEAAYLIDFELKDSKDWAVIHDLRIEHNGRVAQIDHLIIGRYLDIFVIESKNYKTELRVDRHCEFEVKTKWGWKGIHSPIEQNRRHIIVLNDLISGEKLAPMRLGLPLRPACRNWILVPPECRISPRHIEEAIILKMDMFSRRLKEQRSRPCLSDDVLSLTKICSQGTIMDFARKLVTYHRPISIDYAAKFGIELPQPREMPKARTARLRGAGRQCQECHAPIELKVVTYCEKFKKQFGGRVLCRGCQTAALTGPAAIAPAATCDQCGTGVDSAVVAFCLVHSGKFGARVLCRECQGRATRRNTSATATARALTKNGHGRVRAGTEKAT